jgi:CubicO group peptidase (beta-lactamase class C family)
MGLGATQQDGTTAPAGADGLLRGRPGEVGIDPHAIADFVDDVDAAGLDLHTFTVHRQGRVVFEAARWPYGLARPRITHSFTKSVTACAIGILLDEGRLALDDKVIAFFPEHAPAEVDDKLAAMTVEDLLTMRTGHAQETSGILWRGIASSWIAEFFRIPIVYQPGTTYVYTSAASYMLSAIVTKITGERLHDFLKPRLFAPLGIVGERWDIGPDGLNPGGNGLTFSRADALKIGLLHAQGGVWEGRRILSEAWVAAATRAHAPGYGYHWVTNWDGAYSAVGMFVQMVTVFPRHGVTLALTGAIPGSDKITPLMAKHFPRGFRDAPVESVDGDARLAACIERWAQPRTLASAGGDWARLDGARYAMAENRLGVTEVGLVRRDGALVFHLTDGDGRHEIACGVDGWREGLATLPGRDLHHGYPLVDAPVMAGARFRDDATLEMTWAFLETAFRDTVLCRFDGDRVVLDRSVNVNSAALAHPTLTGVRI